MMRSGTMGGIHHHAQRTGFRAEHLIIAGFQIGSDETADVGFILDDQNFILVIAHRRHPLFPEQNGKQRPPLFLFSAKISLPCALMMAAHTDSPMPILLRVPSTGAAVFS